MKIKNYYRIKLNMISYCELMASALQSKYSLQFVSCSCELRLVPVEYLQLI